MIEIRFGDNRRNVFKSLDTLRRSAIGLGMENLAMTYGWSMIRIGAELTIESAEEYFRKDEPK